MGEARFYVPPDAISGKEVTITGDEAIHIISVLRKKPGDAILLFDGQGTECTARIVRIGRDSVVVCIGEKEIREHRKQPATELLAAIPKGRKFDLIVEKATELGADGITPLLTARTVVQLENTNMQAKLDRWRRITVAAAKQCRRSTLPRINPPVHFTEAAQPAPEGTLPILASSVGEAPSIAAVLREMEKTCREIRLYIGPEGGFSPEEIEMAKKAGMRLVSLGKNILRTETAAIAALAVVGCFLDWRLDPGR